MLSDLRSGDQVQATYAPDRTLLEVHARPSGASSATVALEGTLAGKEVDGTMVIATADKAPVAVYADEKTKITINGNRADFPHLDRGDWVRVEVGADRRVAEVRAHTYDPRRPENITIIQGTVSAMMMSGSVAIADKDTAVVVHLTDDSRITQNGQPVVREKILKGSRVWARYGPDRGVLELRILDS